MRGVHLIPEIEARTILPVRAAMNIHDQRMLRGRGHSYRLGEKRFDFKFVVVAHEGERLHFANLLSGKNFCVQVRELARRGRCRT